MVSDLDKVPHSHEDQVKQARQFAWALVKQLKEQLADTEPSLLADILGMAFHDSTRIWPLFKSAPPGTHHQLSEENRSHAYREWLTSIDERRWCEIENKFGVKL